LLDIQTKVRYQAFGLLIASEMKLPELIAVDLGKSEEGVTVQIKELELLWNQTCREDQYFHVEANRFFFKVPDVAIFDVKNGNEISICPMKNSNEDQIRLYVLGSCMGALLLQRKTLPLHGSAVVINGKAYGIVGKSGAGKSTLASAFLQKGYELLTDDVIALPLQNNQPVVIPAYPQQKLWQESLSHFGMNATIYRPIVQRETKFSIPVTSQFANCPVPLAGVVELVKSNQEEIEINEVAGIEKLQMLFNHTYRRFLMESFNLYDWHFQTTVSVANQISMYQLKRPINRFTASELVESILHKIHEGEKKNDK
jgi:hypothetical protein